MESLVRYTSWESREALLFAATEYGVDVPTWELNKNDQNINTDF
jgi:hypothetical protein